MNKIIKDTVPYIIIVILVLLIKTYVVAPVRVDGPSMNNTLLNNQILILNKLDKNLNYGDIIVFSYDKDTLIKRVIGLPGDTIVIKNNKLYINDVEIKESYTSTDTNDFYLNSLNVTRIPNNKYFVMGDNREVSLDSRYIGFIDKKDIIGTVIYRIFPFDKISKINN